MDTIEGLERLNRLREAGALSEEEFQAQKAKLIESVPTVSTSKRLDWRIWAASVGVIVVVLTLLAWCMRPIADGVAESNEMLSSSDNAIAAAPVAGAPANRPTTREGSFAWATSTEIVGMNPAYLEDA
ncbi:SHOCT domain-containing protein [Sphingosinicella terrae]|uniref:SHOCT domain-containing protein n=1 Tax=Sphingosinicella terrae TaxID=2172047 RepID=UPI000E0D9A11|nr:SHOCT domain-containing protein [Sphingosinicella terrae]